MGNASKQIKKIKSKDIIKAKKDDSSKFSSILVIVAAIVSIALVIGSVIVLVSSCSDNKVAMKSKHYTMNVNEFSYFFYSGYYNEMQSNPYMYMYYGLKTDDSLKNQEYNMGSDNGQKYTWYDVFMSNTVETVKQYMAFWEEAYASGLKLDDSDFEQIDKTISDIEQSALDANATLEAYVQYLYGDGNTIKDVKSAIEFYTLAMKQYQIDFDAKSSEISDEDIEKAYKNDPSSYSYVDYRSFAVTAQHAEDATEQEIAAAKEVAKAAAEEICEATSETEFVMNVQSYLTQQNSTADDDSAKTEDEIASEAQDTLTERFKYTEDNEFATWAFTEGREANSTKLLESDETYTAYYLVKAPGRLEYNTKNVRHILIKADEENDAESAAKAQEVLALFNENPTQENFEKLADKYNEDSASLYENIKLGDMVSEFESWCFDENRQAGNCDVVKTQYGYHIIYFVGDGMPTWMAEVKDTLLQEDFEAFTTELKEKYDVKYEVNSLYGISGITAFCKSLETNAVSNDTAAK